MLDNIIFNNLHTANAHIVPRKTQKWQRPKRNLQAPANDIKIGLWQRNYRPLDHNHTCTCSLIMETDKDFVKTVRSKTRSKLISQNSIYCTQLHIQFDLYCDATVIIVKLLAFITLYFTDT